MIIEKRLDKLEQVAKPPSGLKPFDVVYKDPDGNYWRNTVREIRLTPEELKDEDPDGNYWHTVREKIQLAPEELEAIREGCDLLIVVKYDKKIGLWRDKDVRGIDEG